MSNVINVSPFATNILDLIDKPLVSEDGRNVVVRREGSDFVVYINGEQAYDTDDNLNASFYLNCMNVSRRTSPETGTVWRYTTAPVDYDGFGTQTIAVAGFSSEKKVRLVQIHSKHFHWQDCRYGSGMHCCLDKDKWQQLVKLGLATETTNQGDS